MGVIGVVAALTIPNLNGATNDMEKVTKVKKLHAELNEAYSRATAVYGPVEGWFTGMSCSSQYTLSDCSLRLFERISEFMKVTKVCSNDMDEAEGCWPFSEWGFDPLQIFMWGGYKFISNSGAAINISGVELPILDFAPIPNEVPAAIQYTIKNYVASILVDIDGPNKGKNAFGNDIFVYHITRDGVIPADWDSPGGSANCLNSTPDMENFELVYCTGWVVKNGNLDYLKCADKLDWNTKTSCK